MNRKVYLNVSREAAHLLEHPAHAAMAKEVYTPDSVNATIAELTDLQAHINRILEELSA